MEVPNEKDDIPKREMECLNYLAYDDMLPHVGEFGKFQKVLQAAFSLAAIPLAFPILIMYFAALQPGWRCSPNSTICTWNRTFSADDNERCSMPRSEWEFDQPVGYSIVTHFDIYCSGEWKIHLSNSSLFLGWAIGAFVLGWFTDNYGRKRVLFPAVAAVMLTSGISAFSPTIYFLVIFRFLTGFFVPGTSIQMFVMITELAGPRYRTFLGIVFWTSGAIGQMVMCLKAYVLREWKTLFIVCTWPYLVILGICFFVPESVRYLVVKGRRKEAMEILHRIARWNNKTIPNGVDIAVADFHIAKQSTTVSDLFKTRQMLLGNIILGYAWFAVSMLYYGIALAADDFGGSLYTNFLLGQLAQFPGCVLAIYLCRHTRKKTVISLLLLGGIGCGLIAAIPVTGNLKYVRVILGTLGKLCISAAFDSIYVWSSELYRTNVRGLGMGFLQVNARLGGAASPWVAKGLRRLHPGAPFVTMGALAVLASLLLCYQAETKGMAEELLHHRPEKDNLDNMEIDTAC